MAGGFIQETEGIYRLRVPFDRIYTSVFLLQTDEKIILVDCASSASDVDTHIVPALSDLGYSLNQVDILVITHRHSDHIGGLERILQLAPGMTVVSEVRPLCDSISTYPMPGHTNDAVGVLDTRTRTLISGDCLQGAGVDKYPCSIINSDGYQQTLTEIAQNENIENILFSHAYAPWHQDAAMGRHKVLECLAACKNYIGG